MESICKICKIDNRSYAVKPVNRNPNLELKEYRGLSLKHKKGPVNALTGKVSSVLLWRNSSCSYNIKKTKGKMLTIAAQSSTNHLYDLKLLKNGVLFC